MKKAAMVLLLGLMVISAWPSARGDALAIELLGARWDTHTITVDIPSTPNWIHRIVVNAIEAWNQGQIWFTTRYYPVEHTYRLVQTEGGKVTVRFQNLSAAPYMPQSNLCTLGQETSPSRSGTTITSARVTLTAYCQNIPLPTKTVFLVAIHEFGHALGLGHTNFETPLDIMNTFFDPNSQLSTLDLYAVYYLASGGSVTRDLVTLPDNIAYVSLEPSAIPEFGTPLIVLVASLFTMLYFARRVSRKRQVYSSGLPKL